MEGGDCSDDQLDLIPYGNICRLCLEITESRFNIFEKNNHKNCPAFVDTINHIFNLQYEDIPILPNVICFNCLYMVNNFHNFRNKILDCETELKKRLKISKHLESRNLRCHSVSNSIPADTVFIEKYDIIEIDPTQNFSSTEDEFSNDSDTEAEGKLNAYKKSNKDLIVDVNEEDEICNSSISENYTMENTKSDTRLEIPSKTTYLCQYCDMAFVTTEECLSHESRHGKEEPYLCVFCSWRGTNRSNLIFHIRKNHDSNRPYICALCQKRFCRRSDLKKHTTVHTGIRPFTCHFCSKSFSRNTNLTKHLRIHSGERPHVCQLCPRSFTTSSELNSHSRAHYVSRPFQCTRCSSSFARKDKLQAHERIHSRKDNELRLKMDVTNSILHDVNTSVDLLPNCQSQTKNKSNVKYLSVSVTEHCDVFSSEYKSQQEIETDKTINASTVQLRPFKCDICFSSYAREFDLQRHKALHMDMLFSCKKCGISFNRSEKLMHHENKVHKYSFNLSLDKTADNGEKKEYDVLCDDRILSTKSCAINESVANQMFTKPAEIKLGFYNENQQDILQE